MLRLDKSLCIRGIGTLRRAFPSHQGCHTIQYKRMSYNGVPENMRERRGVMAEEKTHLPTDCQAWVEKEKTLTDPRMKSRFFIHEKEALGTVLCLHGYTSGPWQYDELAPRLYKEGYHVLVPLLVGHGHLEGDNNVLRLPKSQESTRFQDYARYVYGLAQAFNRPIHVVGLSGGGAIATYISQTRDIASMTVISPFFRPQSALGKTVFSVLGQLEAVTRLPFGWLLDLIPWTLVAEPGAKEGLPGHSDTYLGHFFSLTQFGERVIAALREAPLRVPTLMFSTAIDTRSDFEGIQTKVFGQFVIILVKCKFRSNIVYTIYFKNGLLRNKL